MPNNSLTSLLPVVINPNFIAPENVINVVYEDDGLEVSAVETAYEIDSNGSYSTELYAPNWINIISQERRITSEGNYVVDVEIEVEDVIGAKRYEVKISKA
jgi:hypothetical protein